MGDNILIKLLLQAVLLLCTSSFCDELNFDNKKEAFIKRMTGKFGYNKHDLENIFNQISLNNNILDKIAKPKEKAMPWFKYRDIFADDLRIINGVKFYRQNQKVLYQAYKKYGVPAEIIVAIIGIESNYGSYTGSYPVIQSLATIAFAYPKREKFFTKELQAFLQMAKENNLDIFTPLGSYAGAMGMAQFMPSSYLHYAIDYNGDGKKDLWHTPADAIFSIANYLADNGWQRDKEIVHEAILTTEYNGKYNHKPFTTLSMLNAQGVKSKFFIKDSDVKMGLLSMEEENSLIYFITLPNFAVITTYNTSPMYAMAVFELSKAIKLKL